MTIGMHTLRVTAVEPLTDESVAITFDVPDELREAFDYAPGQHLVLVRKDDVTGEEQLRRTYSICAPAGSGILRVAVKRLEGGAFSSWANGELAAGAELDVMTPGGRFTVPLDPAQSKRYAAIVAGSGITPVLSLVSTILAVEPRSEFALVYGNRTSTSIMFLEELEDLKDGHPERFELLHVLSREPLPSDLLSGRLDRERLTRLFATLLAVDEVDEWFLCGPLEMIETTRELLLAQGVPSGRIHREIFHADDAPPPPARTGDRPPEPATAVATALLGGRATTFPVAAGQTVLDAMLSVRGDAPYACKGGVCGTCRALVTSGEVRMNRSYALEDAETDAGFVLTCQSHPVTEQVALDFDA
jgi:ring-1,2-phenylacetyl-CoA epoxidase subunit PaaE